MSKKIDEITPKKGKRSNTGRKTSRTGKKEIKEEQAKSVFSDDGENMESESDVVLESKGPEAIETDGEIEEEIDGEELSDLLDVIEQEESIDEVIDLVEDDSEDDSEDIQKLLKYPDDTKVATPETLDTDEDDIVEIVEEAEHKPKSRWLITTCRYCGDMYRFRSDQVQPPTCGRPKCLSRYEEISKKKTALIS